MPQRAATIESLSEAFAMVKAMQAAGLEWGEGYRPLGRRALAEIIEGRMAEAVDAWLDQLGTDDAPDRRNGHYRRHLLTTLGDIELSVPRTRRFSPTAVLRAYARREAEIDRVILAGFVLGLSTRKFGETLLSLLGQKVSATTVSRVAKTLDAAAAAFHRRPLKDGDKVLMLDGVMLSRKTGAPCWWRSRSGLTARRRSSTSAWRPARARPNGSASSPISTAVVSPVKAST
jgi:transposase-like protein